MMAANNEKGALGIGIFIIAGIVFLILAVLISLLVFTFVFADGNGEELPEDEKEVVEYTGITYPLGEFTTNLRDDDAHRIFQVEITLELSESGAQSELEDREPQITDRIYSILRTQSVEDLEDEEGMQELRQKIKNAVNEHITEGEVISVFFNRPLIT